MYIGLGMKDSTISLPLFKVHDALTNIDWTLLFSEEGKRFPLWSAVPMHI